MLKVKSVHEPIEKADGLRILAARYRGRGLPASRYDVWMACLGPSEELLKSIQAGADWRQWSKRYRDEILGRGESEPRNRTILNHGQKFTLRLIKHLTRNQNVTLLCHCAKETLHCHRFLLQALIKSAAI